MSWIERHRHIFSSPSFEEGEVVRSIFQIPKFRENVKKKLHLKYGHNADPFLIAKALSHDGTVVTEEKMKPGAATIPNICEHFEVPCVNLEEFMERSGWEF